jgi:carbamoyltransferase
MKPILSLHSGHDFTLAVYIPERDCIKIIDASTITQSKHYTTLTWNSKNKHRWHTITNNIITKALDIVKKQFGINNDFEIVIQKRDLAVQQNSLFVWEDVPWDLSLINTSYVIDISEERDYRHHMNHIMCGYSQSCFDKAVCLAFDGGGDDTDCAVALINNGAVEQYEKLPYHLSRVYERVGLMIPLLAIDTNSRLDIAGKLMGLSAYGKVDHIAKQEFMDLMELGDEYYIKQSRTIKRAEDQRLRIKCKDIVDRLLRAEDIAATVQAAFEEKVLQVVSQHCQAWFNDYDNNIVLTGGSALNINTNQLIRETFKVNTYVPPNPDDRGLSYGMLINYLYDNDIIPRGKKYNIDNSGMYLFGDVDAICTDDNVISLQDVVSMLHRGQIIGLISGTIEIGPRALGKRSILCDPSFPEMKDVINSKVKHRESFRPFAPVCRHEDVQKYFDSCTYEDLQYMSYAVKVRDQYKKSLSSITHKDGTARVQTVTKEQNELLYNILTEFGGVLLNTSLNVQGKPILNSVEEALYMVKNTGLDAIIINHKNKLHIIK